MCWDGIRIKINDFDYYDRGKAIYSRSLKIFVDATKPVFMGSSRNFSSSNPRWQNRNIDVF